MTFMMSTVSALAFLLAGPVFGANLAIAVQIHSVEARQAARLKLIWPNQAIAIGVSPRKTPRSSFSAFGLPVSVEFRHGQPAIAVCVDRSEPGSLTGFNLASLDLTVGIGIKRGCAFHAFFAAVAFAMLSKRKAANGQSKDPCGRECRYNSFSHFHHPSLGATPSDIRPRGMIEIIMTSDCTWSRNPA